MSLKNIIRIKNNEAELTKLLNEESIYHRELEECSAWCLRNCKYDYFYLIHDFIMKEHVSDRERYSNYFYNIINVSAKYNKFDVFKMLFNHPDFNDCINRERLLEILVNCSKYYRPISYAIANSKLNQTEVYSLVTKFLSRTDFVSIKNTQKIFKVFSKKYKIDFAKLLNHVEDNELFYQFNYGYNYKNQDICFYDLLVALDKKNVFFESLDLFINSIYSNASAQRYKERQQQIKVGDKLECF
jgi:hypothetical protein